MGVGPVLPIINQPADSDLTAIAALSTTAFGRSLLEAANGAAVDTIMGLPSRYVPLVARMIPTYYYGTNGGTSATTFTLGDMVVMPFWSTGGPIDRLVMEVVSGVAGGLCRAVAYAALDNGLPGDLIVESGSMDGTTGALKSATVSATLPPGLVFLGGVPQGALAPSLRVITNPGNMAVTSTSPFLSSTYVGYTRSGVTGTPPASFGAPSSTLPTSAIRCIVRAA